MRCSRRIRLGADLQHVRLLAGLESTLPPVVVHRPIMRIIDGMHRLRAAVLRGDKNICVRFFDGDELDAFVIAVREKVAHGLPLSAADRVVRSHPHWSDRVVAKVAGLSARTVRDVRRSAFSGSAQPAARLGKDGRIRPLDSSAGRIRAAQLMTKEPRASSRNRQVSRRAQSETSAIVSSVGKVRCRAQHGPTRRRGNSSAEASQ